MSGSIILRIVLLSLFVMVVTGRWVNSATTRPIDATCFSCARRSLAGTLIYRLNRLIQSKISRSPWK